MINPNTSNLKSALAELMSGIDEELKEEDSARMTPKERAMSEIAQELLRMERDMLLPGNEQSTSERVRRIGEFIEHKDF